MSNTDKENTREEEKLDKEVSDIELQVQDLKERNELRYKHFDLNQLGGFLNGFFYDNNDKQLEEAEKIKNNDELEDDVKDQLLLELTNEYKISDILSHTLTKFAANLSDETLYHLRDMLSNIGEKQYSIRSKTIALLLQLQPSFKNVPEFQETHIKITKNYTSGNKYEKDYVAYIPKNHKKLKQEQILFITTIFLYNSNQYKYIDPHKKSNNAILDEMSYDAIFIDFIKSLKGKNINETLKYLHLN